MRIGVLGTGTVGRTIATKLRELGHDVRVGSRSTGDDAVPFPDAVLVDVTLPLDFSQGRPPRLFVFNDDSLGEQIQRAFPETRVVKTLNTVNASVMVDPIPGTNVFVCGNEEEAKAQVGELLQGFGWPADAIIDLGDLSSARGTEMYLPLWIRLMGTLGTARFNIAVVQ